MHPLNSTQSVSFSGCNFKNHLIQLFKQQATAHRILEYHVLKIHHFRCHK